MKPLSEYGWNDWRRLRPLTHWLKTRRNAADREQFVRLPARAGDVAALVARIRGQRLLVTVAFDDADALSMQLPLVARFVPQAIHVVADVSMDEAAARDNAAVAARHGVAYVRLPANPWLRPDQASRTHGLSINWVWRNIVQPGEPKMFGFLDDDIFPTAPDDPFALLDRQPIAGVLRRVGTRWFLSIGFSMYRFDAVKDLPLDFGQDWFKGLDTGGANWQIFFRHLDFAKLRFVDYRKLPYQPGADPATAPIEWYGVWLHEVGSTRRDGYAELAADKRRTIRNLLAPSLSTGDECEPAF